MSTRVPTVESPYKQPEIEPKITPDVRLGLKIPEEATGQTMVKATEEGVKSMTNAVDYYTKEMQEKANFAVQNQWNAQLETLKNQNLGEAKTYQGTDAFEAMTKYTQNYNETVKTLSDGIKDSRQKLAFANLSDRYKKELISEIGQHVAGETPKIEERSFNAHVTSKLNTIKDNFDNSYVTTKTVKDLDDLVNEYSDRNNLTPEDREEHIKAAHQSAYGAMLNEMASHNQAYKIPGLIDSAVKSGAVDKTWADSRKTEHEGDVAFSQAYQEFYGDPKEGIKGIYNDRSQKYFDKEGMVKQTELWDYVRTHERFKDNNEHAQMVYNDMWRFAKIQEGKKIGLRSDAYRAWENFFLTQKENHNKNPNDPRYSFENTASKWRSYATIGDKKDMNDLIGMCAGAYTNPEIPSNTEYKVNFKTSLNPDDDSIYLKLSQLEKDKDSGKINAKDYSECFQEANTVLKSNEGPGLDKDKLNAFKRIDEMLKNKFGEDSKQYYDHRDALDTYLKGKKGSANDWAEKNLIEDPGENKKLNSEFFKNLAGSWNTLNVPQSQPLYRGLTDFEEQTRTAKYAENLKTVIGPEAQDLIKGMNSSSTNYKNIDSIDKELEPYLSKPEGIEAVKKAIVYLKSIPPNENGHIVPITIENIEKAIEGGYTIGESKPQYSETISTIGSKKSKVNKVKVE